MLYSVIKPLLFCLDAEFSHDITFKILKIFNSLRFYKPSPSLTNNPVSCFGLTFPNPIGLAAGLDKNAECLNAWQAFGFGFIEVGTVTPRAQYGNQKPRLFRLPQERALINRMGFNNKGVDALVENIKIFKANCPIGINIGKNKETSLDNAPLDYLHCFNKVAAFADYVTVNLSSPNTPGLRSLQHGASLRHILIPLKLAQQNHAEQFAKSVPILVKISPDLEREALKFLIDDLVNIGVDGVIATNTTLQRPLKLTSKNAQEDGGLSGEPIRKISTEMIQSIFQQVGSVLPIIAVGGIGSPEDALEKFKAGAKLIQLYTGLIYEGPSLIERINYLLQKERGKSEKAFAN